MISGQFCITSNNTSPTPNAQCRFPFKFDGKLRDSCITDKDPDGKYWCSTKVDENFEHVQGGGFWGLCEDSCPTSNSTGINFSVILIFFLKLCKFLITLVLHLMTFKCSGHFCS